MFAVLPVCTANIALMRVLLIIFYFALIFGLDIFIRLVLFLPLFRIVSFWAAIIVYPIMIAYYFIWKDVMESAKDKNYAMTNLVLIPIIILAFLIVLYNYTHAMDFVTGRILIIFISGLPVILNVIAYFTYINRKSFVK